MSKILLASNSPRRKEILGTFTSSYEVISSDYEESLVSGGDPVIEAMNAALGKALLALDVDGKSDIILTADTIVVLDEIMGKPSSREDAKNMLIKLSGKTHRVITGICLKKADEEFIISDYVSTGVKFYELDENIIEKYLDTGEYADKAGAYGIQGHGSLLVESISGDYFNVVGLPIGRIDKLLRKNFGVCLMDGLEE